MIYIKDESDVQIWCDYQEEKQQTSADFFCRLRFASFRTFSIPFVGNYGKSSDGAVGYPNGDGNGNGDGYAYINGDGSGYGYVGYGYGDGNGDGDHVPHHESIVW